MKKIIGIFLLLLSANCLAQPTIKVEMPEFANRHMLVTLKKGLHSDTIFNARLDIAGSATVRLPASEADFSGIASFLVGHQEGIDLIINRSDFTFRNSGADFSTGNIQFVNSEENTQFLAWRQARFQHDQRLFMISQMLELYTLEEALYTHLSAEKKRLEAGKPTFNSPDVDNWYAPKFVALVDFLSGKLADLTHSNNGQDEAISVRNYVYEHLDITALYTSGLWFNIIDGFLPVYQPDALFHSSFGRDMSTVLWHTESPAAFEAFASDLLMICQQFAWDMAENDLANFLLNSNRLKNPTNKRLKAILEMSETAPGKVAPAISGIDRFSDGNNKTLLLFYDSGCGSCRQIVADLKSQYHSFVENNVRIIGISADTWEEGFQEYAKEFPWKDTFCDFKGFRSEAFKTYGVVATPTMFLLDNEDRIVGRFATAKDVMEALQSIN